MSRNSVLLPPSKLKGVIIIFTANIFFAINMPVSRAITPDWIHPFTLSFLRIFFAFSAFFILSQILKIKAKFSFKEHSLLLGAGILGTTANQLSFLTGLSKTSPVDASLIITTTPIITMVFAAFIIKEPLSFKKALGVFIGMGGAAVIIYSSFSGLYSQSGTLEGNLIVLISSFVFALYLVLIRPMMEKYSPVEIMKWTFFYGSIVAFPFCFKYLVIPVDTTVTQIWQLGYTLIFGTFVSYLLVAFSLKLLRPTTVSMFNYVQPVIASAIAIAIGQDTLNWLKPVAAALIFLGVYLVITSRSKDDNN